MLKLYVIPPQQVRALKLHKEKNQSKLWLPLFARYYSTSVLWKPKVI